MVRRKVGTFAEMNRILSKQLQKRLAAVESDEFITGALDRIGQRIVTTTKTNIRKQGLVDTGRLMNSIMAKRRGKTLTVGSFGVPYAALHEFGSQALLGSDVLPQEAGALTIPINPEFKGRRAKDIPGLFVRRKNGKAYLVQKQGESLRVAYVLVPSAHHSPKPFLGPAIQSTRAGNAQILSNALRKGIRGGN